MGVAPDVLSAPPPYLRLVSNGTALTERHQQGGRKMTLAVQRQPRFNKVLLALGLVAILAALVVAINQAVETTDPGNPAMVTTHKTPGMAQRFESIQDDYLAPQSILSRQAAVQAELRLQDGYLPPSAAVVDSAETAFLSIQDGYLPPAGWAPVSKASGDSFIPEAIGPQ